ncbi:MAG TPA: OmpA family protein [Allosphingosinicella sp.]|nr:OmpA family protein [Allosphingosinicella sp.]
MRKLAIVVALSSTVLATPALARDGAWYVGGDFGALIVEDINFDFGLQPTIPSSNGNAQIALNHDYGFDAALFVGYDLGSFRVEAEVAYKRARVDDIETSVCLPGNPAACRPVGANVTPQLFQAGGGRTSALSFMINGMLDFGDDDGVQGFVGAGVGMARVDYNNVRAFSNGPSAIDDSDTRFAWQVIAGLRQAVTDNIDVTVRYRFFNADNLRTVDNRGFESESRFRSHSLLGGITFNFGGREPPPTQTCWDGSVIPADASCPQRPIETPPEVPPPQMQTCWDGSSIPVTATCPPRVEGPFVIFFDWDKDEITPQAAAILDNAAGAYQRMGSASVVLAGHADRSGAADYNVGLSQRRANNTRAYLAGRGVPDGSITTEAFGESRPLVDTADGVREPQNRRVEIRFGPGSGW